MWRSQRSRLVKGSEIAALPAVAAHVLAVLATIVVILSGMRPGTTRSPRRCKPRRRYTPHRSGSGRSSPTGPPTWTGTRSSSPPPASSSPAPPWSAGCMTPPATPCLPRSPRHAEWHFSRVGYLLANALQAQQPGTVAAGHEGLGSGLRDHPGGGCGALAAVRPR